MPDAVEGETYAFLKLIARADEPLHAACAGLPVAARVFSRNEGILRIAQYERFFSEQRADATGISGFAAGAIMPARDFYGFPSSIESEQIANERGLPCIGGKS